MPYPKTRAFVLEIQELALRNPSAVSESDVRRLREIHAAAESGDVSAMVRMEAGIPEREAVLPESGTVLASPSPRPLRKSESPFPSRKDAAPQSWPFESVRGPVFAFVLLAVLASLVVGAGFLGKSAGQSASGIRWIAETVLAGRGDAVQSGRIAVLFGAALGISGILAFLYFGLRKRPRPFGAVRQGVPNPNDSSSPGVPPRVSETAPAKAVPAPACPGSSVSPSEAAKERAPSKKRSPLNSEREVGAGYEGIPDDPVVSAVFDASSDISPEMAASVSRTADWNIDSGDEDPVEALNSIEMLTASVLSRLQERYVGE